MYVCLCQGVTDRQIRGAADDGARNVRDLRRQLGVASGCGKCAPCARAVLNEHLARCPRRDTELTAPSTSPCATLGYAG